MSDGPGPADQRVRVTAQPEQTVEERLVDEIRQQAAEDEPARREPVPQPPEQAGTDPDVTEDEQPG